MSLSKSEGVEIIPSRQIGVSLSDRQIPARLEDSAAVFVIRAFAEIFCLLEFLIGGGELSLVSQSARFDRQLPDGFFRIIGSGVVIREKAQSIVVHSAPHHGFNFKELEFSCPFRVGGLELLVSLFRSLLAIRQSPLLEEFPGVVIRGLGADGPRVFERYEEEEYQAPCE